MDPTPHSSFLPDPATKYVSVVFYVLGSRSPYKILSTPQRRRPRFSLSSFVEPSAPSLPTDHRLVSPGTTGDVPEDETYLIIVLS